ncbi:carboxynorspermidine decarboxylase [Peptococcus simiae]|uniref:carboxynorspermidine decarboxylase n=1 Tax=Peptococcus simiae TaxID=1643805 RepID=UPI0039808648
MGLHLKDVPTPFFAIDEEALAKNLAILGRVQDESGAKILLAQKAFSNFALYPMIGRVLAGTTASGLYEARLGHEEMGKETHIFSPAYQERDFDEILKYVDHLSFNSFAQWEQFGPRALAAGKSCGLRINPDHSTQDGGIYDPCAPGSRLGILKKEVLGKNLRGIEGLHFHTLCEQGFDALQETLDAFLDQFGEYLPLMRWLNLGGGHHITRADYDVDALINCVQVLSRTYGLQIYLEPGEAVVLNAGTLTASVVDIVHNEIDIAILDTSAACHMPDVIEMPYRPPLANSGNPHEKKHTYRLAGPTCLAGDVIGDYSFDDPQKPGDRLVFGDMALYTMVKTNTFNGMPLPTILSGKPSEDDWRVLRAFGYENFKGRL